MWKVARESLRRERAVGSPARAGPVFAAPRNDRHSPRGSRVPSSLRTANELVSHLGSCGATVKLASQVLRLRVVCDARARRINQLFRWSKQRAACVLRAGLGPCSVDASITAPLLFLRPRTMVPPIAVATRRESAVPVLSGSHTSTRCDHRRFDRAATRQTEDSFGCILVQEA